MFIREKECVSPAHSLSLSALKAHCHQRVVIAIAVVRASTSGRSMPSVPFQEACTCPGSGLEIGNLCECECTIDTCVQKCIMSPSLPSVRNTSLSPIRIINIGARTQGNTATAVLNVPWLQSVSPPP